MPLFIDLKIGESLYLDKDRIRLTLQQKSGKLARLEVNAPREISISKKPEQAAKAAPIFERKLEARH